MSAVAAVPELPRDPELFFEPLVARYVQAAQLVAREWLREAVEQHIGSPSTRFLLLIGEPGAGKTGAMAGLASAHPHWLRYFIRSDSTNSLSGSDAVSFLLRVGHQFARLQPDAFDPQRVSIEVEQRIEHGEGSAVGVRIDDLRASPFYTASIKVKQDVGELSGAMAAIEINRATLEPRLIEPDTLGQLALFDPALVRLRDAPAERLVVLIDALDEVTSRYGGLSIFDWLEQCPEPPENVCFVISSRPSPRLDAFLGDRVGQAQAVMLADQGANVQRDAQEFARALFEGLGLPAGILERERAVIALARAAAGNFAYLTAYARGLQDAVRASRADEIAELLEFDNAPKGMHNLYIQFARRMRRNVEQLGMLDVADPQPGNPNDLLTPAWEGAGSRVLGVLCVAQAPLSTEQLLRLGGTRIWKSAGEAVLDVLAPFLEHAPAGWMLFHASVGEFLRSKDTLVPRDVAVDATEWHRRIVQHYKGEASWEYLDWAAMDDYGLMHLPAHVDAAFGQGAPIVDLITARLRNALRKRFFSDLPFRRILDVARARAAETDVLPHVLTQHIFLELVSQSTQASGRALDPAVFGLMAAHGRTEEALARAQVSPPSMHRFRALEAIRFGTPAAQRHLLGALDGVEMLVAAAIEIPSTDSPLVGSLDMNRSICLGDAARTLALLDLERALRLAALADSWSRDMHRATDAVLSVAARGDPKRAVLDFLPRLADGRLALASELAASMAAGPTRDGLVDFAMSCVADEGNDRRSLARAASLFATAANGEAADARLKPLLDQLEAMLADSEGNPSRADAAEISESLRGIAPALAQRFLEICDAPLGEDVEGGDMVRAAEVSAEHGRPDDCRRRIEAAMPGLRGLAWYGPARDIVTAARIVAPFDAAWAEKLVDEAMALLEPELLANDGFDRGRLDSILASVFGEFRHWDRSRALRIARSMGRGWIPGGDWDSADGRDSALAVLGLDALESDRALSAALLQECLVDEYQGIRIGRAASDPPKGLFLPASTSTGGARGTSRDAFFGSYVSNTFNYWNRGKQWRYFDQPIDVLRSIDAVYPDTASWARALAHAVPGIAAKDIDEAIAVSHWIADPAERLAALSAVAGTLASTDDVRWSMAQEGMAAALSELPAYEPGIDLDRVQGSEPLHFLDPTKRARLESALLTSGSADPNNVLPRDSTIPAYFHSLLRAQSIAEDVRAGTFDGMGADRLCSQLHAVAIADYDEVETWVGGLLRLSAVDAVIRMNAPVSHELLEALAPPALRVVADLLLLGGANSRSDMLARFLNLLAAAREKLPAPQLACVAALGAQRLNFDDGESASVLAWLEKCFADERDPAAMCRMLLAMLPLATPAQLARMLHQVVGIAPRVGNQYVRADALADALGPAVSGAEAVLVGLLISRLVDHGWIWLCEGLRRAAPRLVETGGSVLLREIDRAMRRAQSIAGSSAEGASDNYVDGVLGEALSADALQAAHDSDWESLEPYLNLYLQSDDLPQGLRQVQDSRLHKPDLGDDAFDRLHGRRTGLCVWLGSDDELPIWRVVDIRFEFPSEAEAAAYHAERLVANSEGAEPVLGAPAVGADGHAFGGTRAMQIGQFSVSMTAFCYVFRVGRIVGKVFVMQGMHSKTALKVTDAFALAAIAAERAGAIDG